jgi:hypothetical protein
MFNGGLVLCSMRLGVPFIAPRQLGAIGTSFGRQFLSSVGWRTDLLPFLAKPTVEPLVLLAHRTVRCDQVTVGPSHVSPADRAVDRWRGH